MNRRADRNRLERKGIADFGRSRRAAGNCQTHLDAHRRDDVALLAVLVLQQGNASGTHRIIFIPRARRSPAVLVALETPGGVFLFGAAAEAARSAAPVMVAPASLLAN